MKRKILICWVMIIVLIFSMFPGAVFAEEPIEEATENTEATTTEPETQQPMILKFDQPDASILKQSAEVGSSWKPVLPKTMRGAVETGAGTSEEYIDLPVTWTCAPRLDMNKAGVYTYSFSVPGEYQISEDAVLPQIKVTITKRKTKIAGIKASYAPKSKTTLKVTAAISPAYQRTLKLQQYDGKKWSTKKAYTLKNQLRDEITITFPNSWWKTTSSKWRIQLDDVNQGTELHSHIITINTKRYYQNPSQYIQLKDQIKLKDSGGYNLSVGYMGLKVKMVNSYFGMGNRYWPRYTTTTKWKVTSFQRSRGLKQTGVVNKETWLKMGFSENQWYDLGAYVSPIKVNPASAKKEHIEAMISRAYQYLGADYIVGASGTPQQGADCSGLVMQGLYAAGADPYPISSVRHSKPGYEYESRNLWTSKKFKTVPYGQRKRGDLIFYRGRNGLVNHIAIYLGNNKVIESWPNKVVVWPIKNSHRSNILGVKRVFN